MKIKLTLFAALFALAVTTATAQTATTTPADKAQQEEKYWVPSKTIPVAEYYEGGQEAMYKFISKELKYPNLAKRNRIQGECIVSFTIDEDGNTSGFKALKQHGGGTGEEAVRVAKLLKFNKTGYGSVVSLPIMFKL